MEHDEQYEISVKTFHGLEEVLAKELKALGANNIKEGKRIVFCSGNKKILYTIAQNSRLALRIMIPFYDFKATTEKELYDRVYNYDWFSVFSPFKTFAISSTVYSTYFTHSQYVGLKSKDAIVDFFRAETGKRPSVQTKNPQISINIHCNEDKFTFSLDLSFDSLHKRGYRNIKHDAPLNEVLAAGMIRLSGWRYEEPLVDPFCGTGTILIEAAMMAKRVPPRHHKRNWCIHNWKSFDKALWQKVQDEAWGKMQHKPTQLYGCDIDPRIVEETNAVFARTPKLSKMVIKLNDFFDVVKPFDKGIIITNPPYGERIGKELDIIAFYKAIGDTLKTNWTGYQAWIISSNYEALKSVGLKADKKHQLYNGALECSYRKFSIYMGSQRTNGRSAKE